MGRSGLILAAAIMLASGGQTRAQAPGQVRCQDMGFGNQTCRDTDGNVFQAHTDGFGNTTVRDMDGNTAHIRSDPMGGGFTAFGPNGQVQRGRTDMFGTTTIQDQQGNMTRCRSQIAPLPGLPGQSAEDCR